MLYGNFSLATRYVSSVLVSVFHWEMGANINATFGTSREDREMDQREQKDAATFIQAT